MTSISCIASASYATTFAPLCTEFLAVLKLRDAPAAKARDAIEVLRGMNTDNAHCSCQPCTDRFHQSRAGRNW